MHSRTMMGTPPNLSKKGVALNHLPQRPPQEVVTVSASEQKVIIEPTAEGMVGKRTEWLEQQQRRLTATVQEQRNENEAIRKQISSIRDQAVAQTTQLFHDSQWLYGWTSVELRGVPSSVDGQINRALEEYRRADEKTTSVLAPKDRWVLLSYPMEPVETKEGQQLLMKMRTVDPRTGQIGLSWAIISEQTNAGTTRAIDEFAVAPHPR